MTREPKLIRMAEVIGRTFIRIEEGWRRLFPRVPAFTQVTVTECGATCLRMVLAYHGHHLSAAEAREACGTTRDGTSVKAIFAGARRHGLNPHFVSRCSVEELRTIARPAILHWGFSHFVVLESCQSGGRWRIVNPSGGRQVVTDDEIDKRFTGVALYFTKGSTFRRRSESRAPLAQLLRWVRPPLSGLAAVLLLSVLLQMAVLIGPRAYQIVVDEILVRSQQGVLALVFAGLTIAAFGQAAIGYLRARVLIAIRMRLDLEMATKFFAHMLRLPYSFFEQRPSGDLLTRLGSNATIRDLLAERVVASILDFSLLLLIGMVLPLISLRLAALVISLALLRVCFFLVSWERRRELIQSSLDALSVSQSCAVEALAAVLSIKASGSDENIVARWRRLFVGQLNAMVGLARLQMRLDVANSLLNVLSPTAVMVLAAGDVLADRISVGTMFAWVAVSSVFLNAAMSFASSWDSWMSAGQHIERLREVIDHPVEQAPDAGRPARRLEGHIVIDNLSFGYGKDAPPVLRNIRIEVEPGAFVAIVGRSGSGKSTLAKVLLGLYAPTDGRVLFDGADLQELRLTSLRTQIGSVLQEVRLLSGTVFDNIAGFEPNVGFDAVLRAAKLVELHGDIERMPLAYDTPIGEGGINISGGQRQRIALARALVAEPRMLVLDEATSALDPVTEAKIFANLAKIGVTRIVIAHRASTIRHAETVAVLHEGSLVEMGSHRQLMDLGGRYAELVALQSATRSAERNWIVE
jgi:ABC-type bacteriocin/lantibiotic exporter with double-glycine peptidase domain